MFKHLRNMDNKFSWSFMGFLIGIVGIVLTIYTIFYYEPVPKLIYQVTTNTDVISMKENVSNLKITYDDEMIDNEKVSLKLLTFQVNNTGNKDIVIGDYDRDIPFGFKIINGHVVDTPLITNTTNEYLTNFVDVIEENDCYIFPNLIIEQNEGFGVRMLVLTNNGDVPYVEALGKIAGIKNISVISEFEENNNTNIFESFKGSIFIQIARLIVYTISGMLIIALIAYIAYSASELKIKVKKINIIKKYKSSKRYEEDEDINIIFDLYRNYEFNLLEKLINLLKDERRVDSSLANLKEKAHRKDKFQNHLDHSIKLKLDLEQLEQSILMENFEQNVKQEQLEQLEELKRTNSEDMEGLKKEVFDRHTDFSDMYPNENSMLRKLVEKDVINLIDNNYKVEKKFLATFTKFYDFASIMM